MMTSRTAALIMCMETVMSDMQVKCDEAQVLKDAIAEFKFTKEEERFALGELRKIVSKNDAFEIGARVYRAVTQLDNETKKQLVAVLEKLARADELISPQESGLVEAVRALVK